MAETVPALGQPSRHSFYSALGGGEVLYRGHVPSNFALLSLACALRYDLQKRRGKDPWEVRLG